MSTTEGMEEKRGISRRDLIKKGAVAGAIVWTVPLIESVPAYAATGSPGGVTTCSYIAIVYTYTTTDSSGKTSVVGPVANKFDQTTGCNPNGTSGDATFCYTCNGVTYSGGGPGAIPVQTSTTAAPVPVTVPSGPCPSPYFYFSGGKVIPMPGVTILFAVAHNGTFSGGTTTTQPYATLATGTGLCDVLTTATSFEVVCGPITNSTSPPINFGC